MLHTSVVFLFLGFVREAVFLRETHPSGGKHNKERGGGRANTMYGGWVGKRTNVVGGRACFLRGFAHTDVDAAVIFTLVDNKLRRLLRVSSTLAIDIPSVLLHRLLVSIFCYTDCPYQVFCDFLFQRVAISKKGATYQLFLLNG